MPRVLTPEMLAAIRANELRPALFVEANFTSGTLYAWTGITQITWNGHDWIGVGTLGTISTIEENGVVEAKGISLGLSGIDASLLSGVLDEFQVGLAVRVYLGCFDSVGVLIPDPITCWAGRMDQPTIEMDGKTATITINCENRLVALNVSVDRRYTNEDQQIEYPGDLGFAFVNTIQDTQIYWGRTPSNP